MCVCVCACMKGILSSVEMCETYCVCVCVCKLGESVACWLSLKKPFSNNNNKASAISMH